MASRFTPCAAAASAAGSGNAIAGNNAEASRFNI